MDVSKGIGLPFQVVKGRCTLTKELLANCVTVISQVDAKFISCVVRHDAKSYLLLVDQHAAHERVCLEKLINRKTFLFIFFNSLLNMQILFPQCIRARTKRATLWCNRRPCTLRWS